VSTDSLPAVVGELPAGVVCLPLTPHRDERGAFTELFRDEWATAVRPVQWNALATEAGVLRGVHVHARHDDYLTVICGRAFVGVRDVRENTATPGAAACVELSADQPCAISLPPGVAHGFYFPEPSLHVYAVSHYWDQADELGCRWDDPALAIPWPQSKARLSPRDAALPSLANLQRALTLVQPAPPGS